MILFPLLVRDKRRIITGRGLYSRTISVGKRQTTALFATAPTADFSGAWWCEAGLDGEGNVSATVSKGLVNTLEPKTTEGKLISDGEITAKWEPTKEADKERMWVVLRVQIETKDGKMLAKTQKDVTQDNLVVMLSDAPIKGSGEYGYAPLALLQRDGSGVLNVHQVAYFDYRHNTSLKLSKWRHYFHVA